MDDIDESPKNQATDRQQFFAAYPKRIRFHANRLLKDFFDCDGYSQLARQGADGRNAAALIIFIATQEDRFGYKGPISFWIRQLQRLLYMPSPQQPPAAIELAVKSGWLASWRKHNRDETYFYTINPIASEVGSNQSNPSEIGSNEDSIPSNNASENGSITPVIASNIPSTIPSNNASENGRTPYLIPSLDPFLNPNLEKQPTSKPKSAIGYTDEFELFWNAYPPRRRTAKRKAYEAWKKAIKGLARTQCPISDGWPSYLVQRATEYAASEVGRDKYVKGPEPWLNGGCWDDPAEAWGGTGKWNGRHASQAICKDGVL